MHTNTRSMGPLVDHFRTRVRSRRDARHAERQLRSDLAAYTTASEIRELEAILDRHDTTAAAPIRALLAERLAS